MLVDCILLIDDDRPTNFLHERILTMHKSFDQVQVAQSGHAALEYLAQAKEGKCVKPNVIFLDINMPAMNGWEFLEEFSGLSDDIKNEIKIFMVTTSSRPEDLESAESNIFVKELISKPLSFSAIDGILERHIDNIAS